MVTRIIQNACCDFEEIAQGSRDEATDAAFLESLREIAMKDSHWEDLNEAQLASIVPLLLGQSGLLELVCRQGQDKDHVHMQCRRHALDACSKFLQLYSQSAATLLQRRLDQIVSGCLQVFRRDVSNQVGCAALHLLLHVLETPKCPPAPCDLGEELMREFKIKSQKMIAGQRSLIFRLLAAQADSIASTQEYDAVNSPLPFVSELPRRLLDGFEREVDSLKPCLETLTGALDALNVFLRRHWSLFTDIELQRLYNAVNVLALTTDAGVRKLGPQKSALHVLRCHAGALRKYYIQDALVSEGGGKKLNTAANCHSNGQFLDSLIRVSNMANKDLQVAGRSTLDAVLRSVSEGFTSDGIELAKANAKSETWCVASVGEGVHKQNKDVHAKSAMEDASKTERSQSLQPSGPTPESSLLAKLDVKDVTLDAKDSSLIESALPDRPETPIIRLWYKNFRKMVVSSSDNDDVAGRHRNVILGVRSLGALAPAILRIDGVAFALDCLEVVLDAFDFAQRSPFTADPDEAAAPSYRVSSDLPEYVESIARMIPVVERWLTSSQWARVIAAGGTLLNKFSMAMTVHRPAFVNSFTTLLCTLGEGQASGYTKRQIGQTADVSCEQLFDALVAQGVSLTVTKDSSLLALWEQVFFRLEQQGKGHIEQQLVDSIVTSVLQLVRQGAEEHFRVHRHEERNTQQMADYIAKAKARGTLSSFGRVVPTAASPLSLPDELQQAVAEADPTFTLHTAYIYQQAIITAECMNQLAALFEKTLSKAAPASRKHLLDPWVENVIFAVDEVISVGRSSGSPPPGIFRLLRVALSVCCNSEHSRGSRWEEGLGKILPGFLEDVAGAVEGYHGVVATEALEALLAVRPDWISAERWLPVFRRALTDGLHDLRLAQHALGELERWREASADLDWSSLLPCLIPYLQEWDVAGQELTRSEKQAMLRAKKVKKVLQSRRDQDRATAQDRATFLRKLLGFIGSLGGECHAMVTKEPAPEELQRPSAALGLRIPLALGGVIVELEPLALLPHLTQVLKRSPQKRLRLAAAEALHNLIRFVIGSDTVQNSEASTGDDVELPTDFADALRSPLLPLALRAAADEDAKLAKLFQVLLSQLISWFATCPPTASLSALRDALLAAMRDSDNSNLRSTAAKYYAELMRAHEARPGGVGGVVAKRLLHHVLAAASHVDRCTQLGALQSLLWSVLHWEAETTCPPAVLQTLNVVVLCLQTSHMDPQGLSTEMAAVQLGKRLLRALAKIDTASSYDALRYLQMQLWQGAGSLEPAARGFSREALLQLKSQSADVVPVGEALTALSSRLKEQVVWSRLEFAKPKRDSGGAFTAARPACEASVVARSLDLLTARIDTELWLAQPIGGGRFFTKSDLAKTALPNCQDLVRQVGESCAMLVPWIGDRIDGEVLVEVLSQYAPRDRERVSSARLGALAAVVGFLRLSTCSVGAPMVDFLLTMILAPRDLLADKSHWKSSTVQRHVVRNAVATLRRIHPTLKSLEIWMSTWLRGHSKMDVAHYAKQDNSIGAFEACFREWPEHKRGDMRGVADRMGAYAIGLEELQHGFADGPGGLWQLLLHKWPGGVEAMICDWKRTVAWYARQSKAAASQHMVQALVRFLLITMPSPPAAGTNATYLLPVAGAEVAMLDAFLSLPRPPKEAISQLLTFFAQNARLLFEHTRPLAASRKRDVLAWLCDFAAFAHEAGSGKISVKKEETQTGVDRSGWDDGEEQTQAEVLSSNFVLRGSVLAQTGVDDGSNTIAGQQEKTQNRSPFEFADLFAHLPSWHEWAVSDALHGGTDDENAPILPPPMKRIKADKSNDEVISRRVRQSRTDRTGLHQLAALLRASTGLQPVFERIASDPELCKFLTCVLQGVINSEHSTPRMKTAFLTSIPPLLLLSEIKQSPLTAKPGQESFATLVKAAASVEDSVRRMVISYFPLRSHDCARESEEYATYCMLLDGLFHALELSAPSVRLLSSLYGTLKEKDHREDHKIRGFVKRFVRHLADGTEASSSSGDAMVCSFDAIFKLFLNAELDDHANENIRFALMEKLALPLLWELTSSRDGCVEAWLTYWPRFLELADTRTAFASIGLADELALELKIQELACIYGAIEILFIRTEAEVLRERVAPRLPTSGGQQSSPSRELTLIAKKALERPPGAERLAPGVLRRFQLRVYSAFSAAICAGQSNKDVYVNFLFKEGIFDDLVEPWATKSIDLSALNPSTDLAYFTRPGYSFAFLSAPGRKRWRKSSGSDLGSQTQTSASLMDGRHWGTSVGFSSLPGTFAIGNDLSLQKNVIKRAVVTKAAQSLTLVSSVHHKTLAATVARATQGAATLDRAGHDEAWATPPPGAEGAAGRLQAALLGRRPQQTKSDGEEGHDTEAVKWVVETMEHDARLFPGGPVHECNLALFLTLLRTFDVMVSRFGIEASQGIGWLTQFFVAVEKPTADFWLRVIFLRLLVLRADVFRPLLYGQHARIFRFIVGLLLDPRFGAEKKFHYLFRDALQLLVVPVLRTPGAMEGDATVIKPPLSECAYESQRLLHHLQVLAPHNERYWQRAHGDLVRAYIEHYSSGMGSFQFSCLEPDRTTLGKQLTAKSSHAPILQRSALRQLATFLEFGGFDPYKKEEVSPTAGSSSQPVAAQWRIGLLGCVVCQDEQLAAFSCGVVGLIAKWHPFPSMALVEEACCQLESQRNKLDKGKVDGYRMALCFEQLLTNCPWALCDLPSVNSSGGPIGGSVRRRFFTRQLSCLPTAQTLVLKPLLAGFLALCRDCMANASEAAAPGAWAIQVGTENAQLGAGHGRHRQPPPRPGGDALRTSQRDLQDEFLVAMRGGDVWRRGLLSGDSSTQSVAASLVRVVASALDEETLLSCTGLMLEAHENMRGVEIDRKDHRCKFTDDLLSICFVVCDRRPDVARGEVAQGILSFLFMSLVHAETDALRDKVHSFWEMHLSTDDAATRLVQLCKMVSSLEDMQSTFIPGALQLLLRLARKSVEFRRTLVRKPLADCEFKPMQFNTSSWMGSQRLRTFQPASTFASAFRSLAASLSQSHIQHGPRHITSTSRKEDPASVQQSLSADGMMPHLVHKRHRAGSSTIAVAAKHETQTMMQAPPLMRHSEKYAASAAIRWNEGQTKAALASLTKLEEEGDGDADTELIRNYRIGNFPDVEVTIEDILEPLMKVGSYDQAMGEELLLTVWSGVTSIGAAGAEGVAAGNALALGATVRSSTSLDGAALSGSHQGLQGAVASLFDNSDADETFAHFLHRLMMRCGKESCASVQLPSLQRSVRACRLSGVQALEELLPDRGLGILPAPAAGSIADLGRHRSHLSALYETYAELNEKPSMDAALAQLKAMEAFTSKTPEALALMHDGAAEAAAQTFSSVLDTAERALPAWEVQMASSARTVALEALMSWDKLGPILEDQADPSEPVTSQVQIIRAELGKSIMPRDFWRSAKNTGKKELDLQLYQDLQKRSMAALNDRLQHSQAETAKSPRGAALLAVHASSQNRRDDVQRLVIQGYDSFAAAWRKTPRLAVRAQHELLSSLPLLHTLDVFGKELPLSTMRKLDVQHDAFTSWVDSFLAKIVIAQSRSDNQFGHVAYAELGHRCRKAKNYATASKLMTCCMKTAPQKEFKIFSEVIKLKLGEGNALCKSLSDVVENEIKKHSDSKKLQYKLLLAKVTKTGCERQQMDELVVWNILKSAQELADQCTPAEQCPAYAKLAEFADNMLRRAENPTQASATSSSLAGQQKDLATTVVESVLKVLEHGDSACSTRSKAFRQAHERLPRVFELLATFTECCDVFSSHATRLPTWVALRWLPQALAHLPTVPVLLGLLKNVVRLFPQAMIWPLQLSLRQSESDSRSRAFQPLWAELQQSTAPIQLAVDVTKALEHLMHPDQRFRDGFKQFHQAIARNQWAVAKQQWRSMWNKCVELDYRIAGKRHKEFAERVLMVLKDAEKKTGLAVHRSELQDKDLTGPAKDIWLKIIAALEKNVIAYAVNQAKQGLGRKEHLDLYSSFLATFDARASWQGSLDEWLEVPGQYSGFERPNPQAHVRILRFTPQVLVMNSKQRPKRLIILGSDEKEHWFLVKGGEDVRLDARIEQLFETINGLVAGVAVPGLRIRTVAVVPLLPDLGLIQWAKDTRTMKSVVLEMAGAKELMDIKAHKDRIEWAKLFGHGAPNAPTNSASYRYQRILEQSKGNIESAFSRDAAKMPASATLRTYLWRVALGPEAFWHLRQRFAGSLAASSAASYILGIGDRHLDNFLLCVNAAEIVPIDFGYSFGIGALLPVPEMAPFRLTNFFLSVLQPLAGNPVHGAFRDGFIHVLSRCREHSGVLLDACAIFLREPLLDWTAESRRRGDPALDFLPKRRLAFVDQRLQGKHPAKVLADELSDSQLDWVKKMLKQPDRPFDTIIAGLHDAERERLHQKPGALTVAEQADCLIRQATDMNVLGRAWEGWAPEI